MRRASVSTTLITAALACVVLNGCARPKEWPDAMDRLTFRNAGGTLFSTPDPLTMKEIHLDNGTLTGRQVIVQGHVMEVSSNYTYLVLSDDTARMLVVLTNVEEAKVWLRLQKPSAIKILGTVENGKKGLPYILAKAFNVAQEPVKS